MKHLLIATLLLSSLTAICQETNRRLSFNVDGTQVQKSILVNGQRPTDGKLLYRDSTLSLYRAFKDTAELSARLIPEQRYIGMTAVVQVKWSALLNSGKFQGGWPVEYWLSKDIYTWEVKNNIPYALDTFRTNNALVSDAPSNNLNYIRRNNQWIEKIPDLILGEIPTTAYRGDRGKIAYDHSQITGNPHATTKADIGLSNADNTSDINKPISTAAQAAIATKVPLTRTVAGKPLSADISLNKSDVGLASVDNTSDTDKPLSAAAIAALTGKQATLISGSSIKSINTTSLLGSGDLTINSSPFLMNGVNTYYTGGNVGIGTNNPTAKLELVGNNASGDLKITNTSNIGSISVASLLAPNTPNGDVYFSVGRELSTTTKGAALVGWSKTGASNPYAFLTTYGRTASDLAVSSNGNVGIGTTNPNYKVSIGSDNTGINYNPGGGSNPALDFYVNGNLGASIKYSSFFNTSYFAPKYISANYNTAIGASFNATNADDTKSMVVGNKGNLGGVQLQPTGTLNWGPEGDALAIPPDVGISRTSPNSLALGNGTQGNNNGFLSLGYLGIGTNTTVTNFGTYKARIYSSDIFDNASALALESAGDGYVDFRMLGANKGWQFSKRKSTENDAFKFYSFDNTTGTPSFNEVMTMLPTGNIGINNSAPSERLSVNYSDDNYMNGIKVRNTNTGVNSFSGISVESNGVEGAMQIIPAQFNFSGLANTMLFASIKKSKLGFVANSSSLDNTPQEIYFKTYGGRATNAIHIIPNGTKDFIGFGNSNPTGTIDISDSKIRVRDNFTPSGTSDATGNVGDWTSDDNYFYKKTSTGWKRIALQTF